MKTKEIIKKMANILGLDANEVENGFYAFVVDFYKMEGAK